MKTIDVKTRSTVGHVLYFAVTVALIASGVGLLWLQRPTAKDVVIPPVDGEIWCNEHDEGGCAPDPPGVRSEQPRLEAPPVDRNTSKPESSAIEEAVEQEPRAASSKSPQTKGRAAEATKSRLSGKGASRRRDAPLRPSRRNVRPTSSHKGPGGRRWPDD